MNWGSLSRGFKGVAIKQLTQHEVDPESSHGHEFQGANNLRGLLGTVACCDRPTTFYFLSDKDEEPSVQKIEDSSSSWYDSRKKEPHRSAEWRLYYKTDIVQQLSHPDDILLLALRNDNSLAVFVAPHESTSEQVLLNAFGLTRGHLLQSGQVKWLQTHGAPDLDFASVEAVEQLSLLLADEKSSHYSEAGMARVLVSAPTQIAGADMEVSKVAEQMNRAWPDGLLGASKEVVKLIVSICDPKNEAEPDLALERWLEVGEASYRLWEAEAARKFISPLRADTSVSDIQLVEKIGERWMGFRQSRVSRAGKVMEEFLSIIFNRAGLIFGTGANAKTEGGKLPDFLFPNAKSYGDPEFPAQKLRILGSKTSFKDRWRQILSEGNRVPRKHGVTRDSLITRPMFHQMEESNFIVVMPEPIIRRYQFSPPNLISLYSFIDEVRGLQNHG
jgi:hypothetical protein